MAVDLSFYHTNFRESKKYPGLFTSFTEENKGLGRAIVSIPAAPLYRTYLTYKKLVDLVANLGITFRHFLDLKFKEGFRDLILGTSWDVAAVIMSAIAIVGDLMRETLALFTRCFATIPALANSGYNALFGGKIKLAEIKLDESKFKLSENFLADISSPQFNFRLNALRDLVVKDDSAAVVAVEGDRAPVVAVEGDSALVVAVEDDRAPVVAIEDNSSEVGGEAVPSVSPSSVASNAPEVDYDSDYEYGDGVAALFGGYR